jgi:hypothetical protein
MSEVDFWNKYFKAEYIHSTKNTIAAAAEAAEDEDLAVFLKDDEILENEARKKVFLFFFLYLVEDLVVPFSVPFILLCIFAGSTG